jgi:ABC-type transport system substrate-binding protein
MTLTNPAAKKRSLLAWVGVSVLGAALIVACGTSSPSEETDAGTASQPAATQELAKPAVLAIPATAAPAAADSSASTAPAAAPASASSSAPAAPAAPAAAPVPTVPPTQVVSAKDTVLFVTNEEPTTVGAASANCGGNIQNTICDDMASDPLTWIDDQQDFQVVGLTGIDSWEQLEADRWRFNLREGITFHNGAPWNATQAKFWIDFFGDEETSGHHNSNDFSFHGVIGGEVVDDHTLDVVCGKACPILPRTTIFTKFQDVGWFEQAAEEDVERFTVGLGPYRIVEWRSGLEIELEAYEDYNPNPSTVFSQAPVINTVIQQWRNEPTVRAAMVQTGEADWAEISLDDRDRVPKWTSATNNEVFRFSMDTVHDPELRKIEVREALNISADCQTILQQIFDGLVGCYANIAQPGTVGITEYNSAPHPYNLERAKQLLADANYDTEHKIVLTMRSNRVPKDTEFGEALVSSWREAGINAELNVVESSVYGAAGRSNCGHQRTREEFDSAEGADLHEKCRTLGPGAPNFSSMHITGPATSTESLDFSRQAILRNSCYSRSSGVCFGDLEMMIEEANATPTGEERRERMEAIANRVHNNFHFVPNFLVVSIYGLSENLEWEPHYAPRIRANTMYFSK